MAVSALGYLGFNVSDLEAWRNFATHILGLMPIPGEDGGLRFRMDSRAWRIAVHASTEDDIAYAGFEVTDREALEQIVTAVESSGVSVIRGDPELRRIRQVIDLAYFLDPIGTRIEVYYGPTEVFQTPFVSPAGVSGFVTGEQGVGHIVLFASDQASMEAFYIGVLGLRLTDIIDASTPAGPVRISFMNCNPRHHSVAIVQAPVPRRLDHFMLEVASIDDMGLAWDRVRESKTPVWVDIGRHTNDHMLSFYAHTPSGTMVEYGWGANSIGSDWKVVRYDAVSVWGHKLITPPRMNPSDTGGPTETMGRDAR